MILWISITFWGTFCAAQNNIFSQAIVGDSPFPGGGRQLPFSGVSAAVGPRVSTRIITPYPACLASGDEDAIQSSSPFAHSLLEGSFTNPFLRGFYNTSFDTASFYDAIYNEVKETLSKGKSQILAGSLSLLFEVSLNRMTPLLNAVSITNAISEILGEQGIVITDNKEDYIEPYLTSISKAISVSDGSAKAQALAVVRGLLQYLDYINALTYYKFHEFINILAGEYYMAIYSTCKPLSYDAIPKP